MTSIERYSGGALVPSRTTRTLTAISSRTAIETTLLNASADIELVRVDALTAIAAQAATQAAQLSRLETTLVEMAPASSARVAAVCDAAAMALMQVVVDAPRRLGR